MGVGTRGRRHAVPARLPQDHLRVPAPGGRHPGRPGHPGSGAAGAPGRVSRCGPVPRGCRGGSCAAASSSPQPEAGSQHLTDQRAWASAPLSVHGCRRRRPGWGRQHFVQTAGFSESLRGSKPLWSLCPVHTSLGPRSAPPSECLCHRDRRALRPASCRGMQGVGWGRGTALAES